MLDRVDAAPQRQWLSVRQEVRWSFTRPWHWLTGVAVNLVLSLLWLIVAPLSGQPHRDWAILVGSYFAVSSSPTSRRPTCWAPTRRGSGSVLTAGSASAASCWPRISPC